MLQRLRSGELARSLRNAMKHAQVKSTTASRRRWHLFFDYWMLTSCFTYFVSIMRYDAR